MRILCLNQFFWPDRAATSMLLTDLVRDLAAEGHEVSVICGTSNYSIPRDSGESPHARILRVRSLSFGRGKFVRVLSYASFYLGAAVKAVTLPAPDVIISMTTPPLLSVLGDFLKRITGARHFIWEMDMYPDVAVDLGVLPPGSAVTRFVGWLADHTRHGAHGIIALGECMKRRLVARGIDHAKIHLAHNWWKAENISRAEGRAGGEPLTILYAGNLGMAHDVETIRGAIGGLSGTGLVRFVFAGTGPQLKALEEWCHASAIDCVEFRPFCGQEELHKLLEQADVGLVTQKNECNGSLVPSKVYPLLAAGLPVLYVGPATATPALLIDEFHCGWRVACGNVDGFFELIRVLAANRDLVTNTGATAYSAFLAHFDRPIATARIIGYLGLTSPAPVTAGRDRTEALHPSRSLEVQPGGTHV